MSNRDQLLARLFPEAARSNNEEPSGVPVQMSIKAAMKRASADTPQSPRTPSKS